MSKKTPFLYMSGKTAGLIVDSIKETAKINEFDLVGKAKEFVELLQSKRNKEQEFLEFHDINRLKDISVDFTESIHDCGADWDNNIADILYSINYQYQVYHDLDSDNWDKVA